MSVILIMDSIFNPPYNITPPSIDPMTPLVRGVHGFRFAISWRESVLTGTKMWSDDSEGAGVTARNAVILEVSCVLDQGIGYLSPSAIEASGINTSGESGHSRAPHLSEVTGQGVGNQ